MSKPFNAKRREFLKTAGAGSLAAAALFGTANANSYALEVASPAKKGSKPKKIIFMVSDGMSIGVPTLADPLSRMKRGKGTMLCSLMENPNVTHGYFDTRSLSSMVTDSAAAACAWATGSRIFNGSLNYLPDGTKIDPIGKLAKDAGYKLGLVTTTRVTHATPAGFAAHAKTRGEEPLIAPQYMNVADVIMGGGNRFFDSEERWDSKDLYAEYEKAGYGVWRSRSDFLKRMKRPDKLLGIFSNSHHPYTIDHMNNEELKKNVPTLAEMTEVALEILNRGDKGFLLQVEGGRVDHGAHGNDVTGTLWDQIAFDDAIEVAVKFVEKDPDAAVVITTDHGNANPGLNGMGTAYVESTSKFENLMHPKASVNNLRYKFEDLAKAGELTPDMVMDITKDWMGVEIEKSGANAIAAIANGAETDEYNINLRSLTGVTGQVLGNQFGVQWIGTNHTADHVMIATLGAGQEEFHGLMKNTKAYDIMAGWMGIDHKNPSMPLDKARKLLEESMGS